MRIASPERWWRVAAAPLIAGILGWVVSGSVRLGIRPGTSPGLSAIDRTVITGGAVAIGCWLAALIFRTHLTVSDEGLADHRMFRIVWVPWQSIVEFEVRRPGGLWGGYCVSALCRDGAVIDLMSTRAYSRVPSARHVDELYRICWTLEEVAARRE
jgi:hypothetical protein